MDIVYIDESGIDRHLGRTHARAPRGKTITTKRPGKRFKRINVIAAQCNGEIIAPCLYEWSTKAVWFETWFEWHLCPQLNPNSVVIMDNAKFHRKTALAKIAAFYGITLLFLPPYSPDKNSIEHLWANMKSYLRKNAIYHDTIQKALGAYFNLN